MEDTLDNKSKWYFKIDGWLIPKLMQYLPPWIQIWLNLFILDGDISDSEWKDYFDEFITPFAKCDVDGDFLLLAADITACIEMAGSGIE